ncbi:Redox-sensing transcriptional repressor Rex [bioreactor metagenome]|uniref:Redox-sensing transcriptional repressor Rex n=1 Tax=bioreactor metagenome TaxID=1076179 RepID=A0A644T9A7_9ZZZZ|nr:redox-sensing transcriptional repressor Rex [Negativicutes bacterium]
MKDQIIISKATIDRLPLYYRTLRRSQEEGLEIISSEELGHRLGVTPEQIRKDLAAFGQFGKKGVGYFVRELIRNIGEILGLDRKWSFAVVGIGHLGWALVHYRNFKALGFHLAAMFDVNPEKIGQDIGGVIVDPIERIEEIIKERNINIGVIAVPQSQAQAVADRLVGAGVRGIWNFAPCKINVPESVKVVNEDLSVGLSSLSYYLGRML